MFDTLVHDCMIHSNGFLCVVTYSLSCSALLQSPHYLSLCDIYPVPVLLFIFIRKLDLFLAVRYMLTEQLI